MMGKISDTYGRKVVLLVSFGGTGLSYFLVIGYNYSFVLSETSIDGDSIIVVDVVCQQNTCWIS